MNDDFPCCKHGNEHVSPNTPPTSPLPDLSRWHPVPVGATVPRGTEWAMKFTDGTHMTAITSAAFIAEDNGRPIWTEHPIPAPDDHESECQMWAACPLCHLLESVRALAEAVLRVITSAALKAAAEARR